MTGRYIAAVGLVLATALTVAWASHGPAQATTFNPFFGPPDFYRLEPTTAGANADVHAQFNVLPPSANFSPHFGGSITFEDSNLVIAGDQGIQNGAYVGQLETVADLGLANDGCNNEVPVTFNLMEANTVAGASAMSPNVTLTAAINNAVTSFTYTAPGTRSAPPTRTPPTLAPRSRSTPSRCL